MTPVLATFVQEVPSLSDGLAFLCLVSVTVIPTREMFRREVPRLEPGVYLIAGTAGLVWLWRLLTAGAFTPLAIADLGAGYVFLQVVLSLLPVLALKLSNPIMKRHSRALDKLFESQRRPAK